jgi:DNA-binding MarR family transcriptional regulator
MFDTGTPCISVSEVSVSEVSWMIVAKSRGLPNDRLAIGQILVRLLHQFRTELFARAESDGRFLDIRFPHLQVWGNLGIGGIRLTDLAAKAQLSLAACSELVDELQDLGYLKRRPDPSDGRAKLIFPTAKGREVLDAAGQAVADLEQRWSKKLPRGAFDIACNTLNDLIVALENEATPN